MQGTNTSGTGDELSVWLNASDSDFELLESFILNRDESVTFVPVAEQPPSTTAPAVAGTDGKIFERDMTMSFTPYWNINCPPVTTTCQDCFSPPVCCSAQINRMAIPDPKSTARELSVSKNSSPRKKDPPIKTAVTLGPNDVVCERGGRSNSHLGNKIYLEFVRTLRDHYARLSTKKEKTLCGNYVVDWVHLRGGRFVSRDKDANGVYGHWWEVERETARLKSIQALRD